MKTTAEPAPYILRSKCFLKGPPQKRQTSKSQHKILKCYLAKFTNLGEKMAFTIK